MPLEVNPQSIEHIGNILIDKERPLKERFRALFTLKNLGGHHAIDCISKSFSDSSALLKHELAYCLGQMQDDYAVPVLIRVLENKSEEAMVRHEAGEALGAIGSPSVLKVLEEYSKDPVTEVAETCQLALERIKWLQSKERLEETLPENPYSSVDPAPPAPTNSVPDLEATLLNESESLFKRYRAMFTLRNIGGEAAVKSIAKGLKCKSALFRHEIAYILGQMAHEASVKQLIENLKNPQESSMVRHECAEALGSIATDECIKILETYQKDSERVVKESCDVALDMCEYNTSDQFQYADGLDKVATEEQQH